MGGFADLTVQGHDRGRVRLGRSDCSQGEYPSVSKWTSHVVWVKISGHLRKVFAASSAFFIAEKPPRCIQIIYAMRASPSSSLRIGLWLRNAMLPDSSALTAGSTADLLALQFAAAYRIDTTRCGVSGAKVMMKRLNFEPLVCVGVRVWCGKTHANHRGGVVDPD